MIHHQRRREPGATSPLESRPEDHAAPAEPEPEPAAGSSESAEAVAVVPRQERRPARDAYDLYAQIYAIRTEDHRA